MMSIDEFVKPMRDELVQAGFVEVRTPEAARELISQNTGTLLIVINSMCGCAGALARPAVLEALQQAAAQPDQLATVFAGYDREATDAVRSFIPYPPSSPSIALFRGNEVVWFLPREGIEGYSQEDVSQQIIQALNTFCQKNGE